MKQLFLTLILPAMLTLVGCTKSDSSEMVDSPITPRYNIVVVLDGTDRLQTENVVLIVGCDELQEIASKMLESGVGTLYITYIDDNSDNNKAAILDFDETEPVKPGPRPSYVPVSEYREEEDKYREASTNYENNKKLQLSSFERDFSCIVEQAYSEVVATNKRGSDVNGAINQAYRLLKPNMADTDRNYVILFSDGDDNIGKELHPKPEGTELYLVNGTVSKHSLGDIVDNEFVTIKQIIKHIFK